MKKQYILMSLAATALMFSASCKKENFDSRYRNPAKVESASVDKGFAGMIYSYRELIVPSYGNYFVTLRPTIFRYTQTTGYFNETNLLTPGAAALDERWERYYRGLTQFRDMTNVYNSLPEEEKTERQAYLWFAKIVHFDQTQQVVDLHGSIPWSEAGTLRENKGDYSKTFAKFDKAEDIYKTMLDELKVISDALVTYKIPASLNNNFATQDLINGGNLDLWRKYCNSLRLRMLTRVQSSAAFSSRATAELKEIIDNPTKYPVILVNADNAQLDVFNPSSDINSRGLKDALESGGDWYANLGSKGMIDQMNTLKDPRLPILFEKGAKSPTAFIGLDPSLTATAQLALARGGTISIYNKSTFSQNQVFPGILFSAAESNFLIAEYYVRNGQATLAKAKFDNGVRESINMYYAIRSKSNNQITPITPAPTVGEIDTYLTALNWAAAPNKLNLIANQKWIHFNITQPIEGWSEVRRLDYPKFSFVLENSDIQKTVPVKWQMAPSEVTYNNDNYKAVEGESNPNTKLFWDLN